MNHSGDFAAFTGAVGDRLKQGRDTYGNRSFERPAVQLVDEVLEELEDVAGWAFILWVRLRRVRDVLVLAERQT